MLILHNEQILDLTRQSYRPEDIREVSTLLHQRGTFHFPRLETGLFSAALLNRDAQYTGYDNVWVRDNIHVAHAHYVIGRTDVAVENVESLLAYFSKHRRRFEDIILREADPDDPMNRPHVRFNGRTLDEVDEKWAHAQNDALGYFLWLYCKLALEGYVGPRPEQWDILGLFPRYFQAIRYWEDEDSGHWEETRKIEASSIGVVVAGLEMMRQLLVQRASRGPVPISLLEPLIRNGREALSRILPSECIQPEPSKRRRYDAALLFLIYPLQAVNEEQADAILHDVETHLKGDHGIRRYLGDSFWCANYKEILSPEVRTADFSDDMSFRNALLKEGEEAQWCVFDPIISAIYGNRYVASGDGECFRRQVHYFNRSLGQLTGEDGRFPAFLCPELYYLEKGRYAPNDVTPLLWTQANLRIALNTMEQSLQRGAARTGRG